MIDALLTQEEMALREKVRRFVKEEVDPQLLRDMDADEVRYPKEYVRNLAKHHLLGLRFPEKYGGQGLPWTAEVTALEEIGVLGSSLGCLFSLPSIVGEALAVFGNEEQKQKYLRPILEGKMFCAEALTEPRSGSDFFGATTRAVKDGSDWLLTGQKRFVVGAEGADCFLVYVKTEPDADPHKSISVFIVERDMGVEVKRVYGLMGTRGGGTGRIVFNETRVPEANLIGELNAGATIFNQMMIPERLTSAAGAVGGARAALEVAAKYSTKRKAFGKKIMKFQGVNFKIADSVAKLDAARALVYVAAATVDSGRDARRIVSEAKRIATDFQWEIINHAMQVMGGIGYTDVFPIERMLRDARLPMIWTGTNEIMNLLIQHEYYKELMKESPSKRDVELDAFCVDGEEEKIFE